jgi:hypothetical protein
MNNPTGFIIFSAVCLLAFIFAIVRFKSPILANFKIFVIPKNQKERRELLGYYVLVAILLIWVIGSLIFLD